MRVILRISLSFTLLAAVAPVHSEDGPKSWEMLGLLGRVRTLTESKVSNISASNPDGTPFQTATTRFSPDGNAVYFEECVSYCDQTYFAWRDGQLIEERREYGNQLPSPTIRYVRDANGKVMEEQTFFFGKMDCRKSYFRNDSQDEMIEYCLDRLASRRIRSRDERTGIEHFSFYVYGPDENTIAFETNYDERKEQLEGGIVRSEQRSPLRFDTTTTDSKGRILEETTVVENSYERRTYKYDYSGREIEFAEWKADGSVINGRSYVYLNDPMGNWIRRTEFFWSPAYSEPVEGSVTVRRIDYY